MRPLVPAGWRGHLGARGPPRGGARARRPLNAHCLLRGRGRGGRGCRRGPGGAHNRGVVVEKVGWHVARGDGAANLLLRPTAAARGGNRARRTAAAAAASALVDGRLRVGLGVRNQAGCVVQPAGLGVSMVGRNRLGARLPLLPLRGLGRRLAAPRRRRARGRRRHAACILLRAAVPGSQWRRALACRRRPRYRRRGRLLLLLLLLLGCQGGCALLPQCAQLLFGLRQGGGAGSGGGGR